MTADGEAGGQPVDRDHAPGTRESARAPEPPHDAVRLGQAFAGEHEVGDPHAAGQQSRGHCRPSPGLFLDLQQIRAKVGEEAAERATVPGGVRSRRGRSTHRDRHGAHSAVLTEAGLALAPHAGRRPAFRHGCYNGDPESRERLELAPSGRVGVDPADDHGAHVNGCESGWRSSAGDGGKRRRNLAVTGPASKGSTAVNFGGIPCAFSIWRSTTGRARAAWSGWSRDWPKVRRPWATKWRSWRWRLSAGRADRCASAPRSRGRFPSPRWAPRKSPPGTSQPPGSGPTSSTSTTRTRWPTWHACFGPDARRWS